LVRYFPIKSYDIISPYLV